MTRIKILRSTYGHKTPEGLVEAKTANSEPFEVDDHIAQRLAAIEPPVAKILSESDTTGDVALKDMTNTELIDLLLSLGGSAPARATKAQLLELIAEAEATSGEADDDESGDVDTTADDDESEE